MPALIPLLRRPAFWCVQVLCLLVANLAAAATLPAGFVESQIASGLRRPTAMTFAPDGRLFVCEQAGTLRLVKDGVLLATPFLSLPVDSTGERGLLGVAIDPAFASNRYVYVYYTATNPNTHNRVSRFTANGDIVLPGSELVLLDLEPLGASNHNGGAIHFGPDGMLYIAVGENGLPSNAQTLANRLGKILRINPDGSIPADNPFYTRATGQNRAIWALGLRNPFTFAFQPVSGTMFLNDVGENAWEEVNEGVAGANYGWPDTEGPTSDPRFRSPLYAYSHANGCAIAGGAFHSLLTPNFPFSYWGAYIFADLCGGWIRSRRADGVVTTLATGISQPVDLQVAGDGTLYYLARGGGSATGAVVRIAYVATPHVDLTANGSDGPVSLTAGQPLQIDFAFDTGGSSTLTMAEIYVGVSTAFGLFWLDPIQGFTPALARAYTGPLSAFEPTPLLHLQNPAAALPPGTYFWLILVDDDVDGAPTGDFSDFVLTAIP
jgi:glucose/arabinose dehydrogenase